MKPSQTNNQAAKMRRGSGRPLKRRKLRANWLVLAFFVVQIGFDLAHSVTAFPFVHYGMYSESFPRPDSILVYRIAVDGVPLRQADFSIYGWDMVQGPLAAESRRVGSNDYAFDKEKFLAGLRAVHQASLYNQLKPNLDNRGDFASWYKGYLGRLLGHPVGALTIEKTWWRWKDGRMQLLGTQNWING